MRVERHDCLARPVVVADETLHDHRQLVPPDGVAQEDRVVAVPILDGIGDLGEDAVIPLPLGAVGALVVVLRVGVGRLDAVDLGARELAYALGHLERVAGP